MQLGSQRRRYLAENFAKTAEYVFSIVILGQVIAGKFNLTYSAFVIAIYLLLVTVGAFILPEEDKK